MKHGKHPGRKQRRQDLCWKIRDSAQSFVLRSYTMHESSVGKKMATGTFTDNS